MDNNNVPCITLMFFIQLLKIMFAALLSFFFLSCFQGLAKCSHLLFINYDYCLHYRGVYLFLMLGASVVFDHTWNGKYKVKIVRLVSLQCYSFVNTFWQEVDLCPKDNWDLLTDSIWSDNSKQPQSAFLYRGKNLENDQHPIVVCISFMSNCLVVLFKINHYCKSETTIASPKLLEWCLSLDPRGLAVTSLHSLLFLNSLFIIDNRGGPGMNDRCISFPLDMLS